MLRRQNKSECRTQELQNINKYIKIKGVLHPMHVSLLVGSTLVTHLY